MRALRYTIAVIAFPVAFFAVVVLRGAPIKKFWHAYWADTLHPRWRDPK